MTNKKEIVPGITLDDLYRNEDYLCSESCEYFITEYCKIEDRDATGDAGIVIPFTLWDAQKDVLKHLIQDRLVQILKANQLGQTWELLAAGSWYLKYNPGFLILGISETELKAKELIRRIDFIFRHLPKWMITDENHKTAGVPWYEATTLTLTIHHPDKNGKHQEDSMIQTFPSAAKAAASFTANLFLFDEWALQQFAREIWTYAFPTINRPNGGKVWGISTIERGSLFEDIWKNEENAFVKIFLPWNTDPRRDNAWYEKTVGAIGLDETHKHYPATVEEAFAIPGGAFFSEFRSLIHIKPKDLFVPEWYSRYRFLDYGFDMLACYWVYIDERGFGRIYREIHKKDLVISQAAYEILRDSGADVPETVDEWDALAVEEKQRISKTQSEKILMTYAPPDLFERSKETTGKTLATTWFENGVTLSKTKNDFPQGCQSIQEWLHPIKVKNEQTGVEEITAKLTIDGEIEDGKIISTCAPNLVHSLLNIQKDKNRPRVYSKQPHNLSHSVDSLRGFCTEYSASGTKPEEMVTPRVLEFELADDYDNYDTRIKL